MAFRDALGTPPGLDGTTCRCFLNECPLPQAKEEGANQAGQYKFLKKIMCWFRRDVQSSEMRFCSVGTLSASGHRMASTGVFGLSSIAFLTAAAILSLRELFKS